MNMNMNMEKERVFVRFSHVLYRQMELLTDKATANIKEYIKNTLRIH